MALILGSLTFVTPFLLGDRFKELVEPYLFSGLNKGIPSLFADIKALYKDLQKQQMIEGVVEALREKLAPMVTNSADLTSAEPPTTYLWTLYFLAQHYSYLSQHARALELLEHAIAHTPTLPELLMFKARVLKRCGDLFGAARCMDEARLLDLQDRFLNTKCAQYRLRAGFIDEANEILGLFTKVGPIKCCNQFETIYSSIYRLTNYFVFTCQKDASSPGADLEDMQSLLYLTEEADAQLRKGNLGLALKRYTAVQKVRAIIETLRRSTIYA